MSNEELAAALVGTKHLPSGLCLLREQAQEAWAYHRLDPYPRYHFTTETWKVSERGPLPRCMPFVRSIVERGARWLFGRPLGITCPGNAKFEEFIKEAFEENRMPSRLRPMARRAAVEGGIVLKFAYDENADRKLSIQSLSAVDQVQLYFHPHDRDVLLMARIQYPYFDAKEGKAYWYREEWTDKEEVHYEPVPAGKAGEDPNALEWGAPDRKENRMGEIPLVYAKNLETDDVWGAGDLWDLFRVVDRVNLTYHLMDRSNQFDSQTNPIFLDAELRDDEPVRAQVPGEPKFAESIGNNDGSEYSGKVIFPPSGNSLRPAMMEHAKDLRKQILAAASSVEVDQSEFSNKGNLTNAVLAQLYLPQIEITEDKRKSLGEDGLEAFLAKVGRCLGRLGVRELGLNPDNPESFDVEITWPDYFELSENEKAARLGRIQEAQLAGYLTQERAVELYAKTEGLDAKTLKDELAAEPKPSGNISDPANLDISPAVKASIGQTSKLRQIGGKEAE